MAQTEIVFVLKDCFVSHPETGMRWHLRKGQAWSSEDALVRAFPNMFTGFPKLSSSSTPPRVERATRAPGEVRTGKKTTR